MHSPLAERFADDDAKWQAVLRRDLSADRYFFCAVKTTGIFCRPSCAAKPPRRENVIFYATFAEAERAGYRPCKRCRPDLPPRSDREAALITEACRRIEAAAAPPKLLDLAGQAGVSPYYFHRLFKRVVGVTPRAYAATRRQNRAQQRLQEGSTVTESFYAAGFNSAARFYDSAPQMLGMKPSTYRRGGAGETIWHAVRRCSLGYVLVAAAERGLCSILFGDTQAELVAELKRRFPKAKLDTRRADFGAWVEQVIRFVDSSGREGRLDLPLDIRGTAFQRRVWEVLQQIPAGETASYAEVARRLGKPSAVRAVAGACAANLLAVAIPCHRVVASNGKLAGYRWGIERKRKLLEKERGAKASAPTS
jgi:AraC family transcriptional regulator of adaptative response/methylated-DNA-[protein]-cysteine methyltransferase